jgi:hypothetical protein
MTMMLQGRRSSSLQVRVKAQFWYPTARQAPGGPRPAYRRPTGTGNVTGDRVRAIARAAGSVPLTDGRPAPLRLVFPGPVADHEGESPSSTNKASR